MSKSPLAHLAVSVGHSERHVGRHEKQQRLLLRQLLPQSLDHLGSFGGSLQINSNRLVCLQTLAQSCSGVSTVQFL